MVAIRIPPERIVDDGTGEQLLEVLDPEVVTMLATLREEPLSAKEVADRADVSLKTAYRRLETLEENDLVEARTMPDERGNHYTAYRTAPSAVVLEFDFEDGTVTVDRQDDDVTRFMNLWEGLQDA